MNCKVRNEGSVFTNEEYEALGIDICAAQNSEEIGKYDESVCCDYLCL